MTIMQSNLLLQVHIVLQLSRNLFCVDSKIYAVLWLWCFFFVLTRLQYINGTPSKQCLDYVNVCWQLNDSRMLSVDSILSSIFYCPMRIIIASIYYYTKYSMANVRYFTFYVLLLFTFLFLFWFVLFLLFFLLFPNNFHCRFNCRLIQRKVIIRWACFFRRSGRNAFNGFCQMCQMQWLANWWWMSHWRNKSYFAVNRCDVLLLIHSSFFSVIYESASMFWWNLW